MLNSTIAPFIPREDAVWPDMEPTPENSRNTVWCPDGTAPVNIRPSACFLIFFASRLPGTLDEIEDAVNTAGSCKSQEEAAFVLRPEISLPSGLRWLRRRIKYVKEALTILAGLLVTECASDLESFRKKLGTNRVLTKLRAMGREYLPSMPPIVGFGPRSVKRYCQLESSNN